MKDLLKIVIQTRRIQLRLQTPAHCRQLVDLLQRRGMEFTLRDRPGTARPNTSANRPDTSQTDFRPLTGQTSSSYFAQDQPNSQHDRLATNGGRSMQPPIKAPPAEGDEDLYGLSPRQQARSRVDRAPDQSINATVHRDGLQEQYGDHVSSSRVPTGTRVFSRDESIARREVQPPRPTTAQLWRSHTLQPRSFNAYDIQPAAARPGVERPSSASNTANLEALREAFENRETSSNAGSEPRPSTSLTVPDRTQTAALQQEDAMKRPATATSSSRPGSSSLDLPPLRRPSLVKEGPRRYSRPASGIPPIQPPVLDAGSYSSTMDRGNVDSAERANPSASTLAPPKLQTNSGVERKVTPMNELLYGSKPLAERSSNACVQRVTSYTDAPHEIESPPATANPSVKQGDYPGRLTTAAAEENSAERLSSALIATANTSLEVFAAQSQEDRDAALEQFMIDNLRNPAFATLCEDIENCWQRIALGL